MPKLTEYFLNYIPQHAFNLLKRSGTKLEMPLLSAGVFKRYAECNLGNAPVSVIVTSILKIRLIICMKVTRNWEA